MRLTLHTDLALRLLMLLAIEPDQLHTIEEAARRYGVSRNHLMKVTQTLAQAGFIESTRGRNGGLRLARPAASVSLGAVPSSVATGVVLSLMLPGRLSQPVSDAKSRAAAAAGPNLFIESPRVYFLFMAVFQPLD